MDSRTRLKAWLAAGLVLAFSSGARADDLKWEWKDGLTIKGDDTSCKMGGRIYVDAYFLTADKKMEAVNGPIANSAPATPPPGTTTKDGYPFKDGVNLRSGILNVECTIYKRYMAKFQPNFAGGAVGYDDVWFRVLGLPGDFDFTVGNFYEPIGLEMQTSSRFKTFMEDGPGTQSLLPGRHMGMMLSNEQLLNKTATFSLGVFRPTGGNLRMATPDDTAYNLTSRVSFAPLLEEKGKELLHFGLGASWISPPQDTISFGARPEINQGPTLIQTGNMGQLVPTTVTNAGGLGSVKSVGLYVLEFAAQEDFGAASASLQSEYMLAKVNRRGMGNPSLWSYYLQGSVMLNGYRVYDKGVFGRPKVKDNAFVDGGWGALELALKWSQTDFRDKNAPGRSATALTGPFDSSVAHTINDQTALPPGPLNFVGNDGGKMSDVSLALNWYMTPNFYIRANYTTAKVTSSDSLTLYLNKGRFNAFQTRFQADW